MRAVRAQAHGMRFNCATRLDEPKIALEHARKEAAFQEDLCRESGEPARDLSIALHHLADACIGAGLHEEASRHIDRVIEIREGLPGFTRHSLYSPLMSQGYLNWIKGDAGTAIKLFKVALKDREAAYGPDDRQGGR